MDKFENCLRKPVFKGISDQNMNIYQENANLKGDLLILHGHQLGKMSQFSQKCQNFTLF